MELTMYLHLSRKYYVAAVPSKRSSKTLERQEILETRMGHTICCLIIPIFWVLNILTEKKDSSNNRRKSSEQDRFVDE